VELPADAPALVTAGSTADVLARFDRPAALLTQVERDRADAFRRSGDRDDFVAGHLLVRSCAADRLGTDPGSLTLVQRCATCGGPHGQPSLREAPELAVSLAHTRGHVAATVGLGRVGVDVERVRTDPFDDGLMRMALTEAEAAIVLGADEPWPAFLRFWVAKESLIKAGAATLDQLRDIDLAGQLGESTADAEWAGRRIALWRDADVLVGYAGTASADYAPAGARLS
jgi:4'-phosphopantetheinyl transferase